MMSITYLLISYGFAYLFDVSALNLCAFSSSRNQKKIAGSNIVHYLYKFLFLNNGAPSSKTKFNLLHLQDSLCMQLTL